MRDSIAAAIATVVITGIRIGIGYAAAWVADDKPKQQQPAKETADNKQFHLGGRKISLLFYPQDRIGPVEGVHL